MTAITTGGIIEFTLEIWTISFSLPNNIYGLSLHHSSLQQSVDPAAKVIAHTHNHFWITNLYIASTDIGLLIVPNIGPKFQPLLHWSGTPFAPLTGTVWQTNFFVISVSNGTFQNTDVSAYVCEEVLEREVGWRVRKWEIQLPPSLIFPPLFTLIFIQFPFGLCVPHPASPYASCVGISDKSCWSMVYSVWKTAIISTYDVMRGVILLITENTVPTYLLFAIVIWTHRR
jgi:hypothetical protein